MRSNAEERGLRRNPRLMNDGVQRESDGKLAEAEAIARLRAIVFNERLPLPRSNA